MSIMITGTIGGDKSEAMTEETPDRREQTPGQEEAKDQIGKDGIESRQSTRRFWQRIDWGKNKKALIKRAKTVLWVTYVFTVTGFLGRFWMVFELTSHFRVQYFCILFLASVILLCRKKWVLLGVSLFGLLLNGMLIFPWYIPCSGSNEVTDGQEMNIRVLISNVHTRNDEHQRLIDFIREQAPDIVVLEEVNSGWATSLQGIEKEYPHNKKWPRPDSFGIALHSRIPLVRIEVREFGEGYMPPTIIAEMNLKDTRLKFIATHPLPPIFPSYFSRRNSQLEALGGYIAALNMPCIVAGDMNLTVWSHYYRKFLNGSGLKDTRKGFGLNPTWPTTLPLLYIPIDHCFYSGDIKVTDYRTGPRIGSDHLPIIVDLSIY